MRQKHIEYREETTSTNQCQILANNLKMLEGLCVWLSWHVGLVVIEDSSNIIMYYINGL